MTRRAEKDQGVQVLGGGGGDGAVLRQLLLPMLQGMWDTRAGLFAWCRDVGMSALGQLFEQQVQELVGPTGAHDTVRRHNRWGAVVAELPFAGRKIQVQRPRVRRAKGGGEVTLPAIAEFRQGDPVPEHVLQKILLGVSTRGYEQSLAPAPPLPTRGASKSAAGRHLITAMHAGMKKVLARPLADVRLAAMLLDGIQLGEETVVAALGIDVDGKKLPLGLWQGSTENAVVCTALLQNLLARSLQVDGRMLFIIDGGKGLRKALVDVFGDRAVVQRCQLHKRRNVKGHLPEGCRTYVDRQMADAYRSKSAALARKRLQQLLSWLERNGHDGAAASLREGLEETLTVLKLNLPPALVRSLVTTNAIENLMGTIRRVARNVHRWRTGMARRWAASGIQQAEKRFRRIKGYRELPKLLAALAGPSENAAFQRSRSAA